MTYNHLNLEEMMSLGGFFFLNDRYSDAQKIMEEANTRFGPHPQILLNLAILMNVQARFEETQTYCEQALHLHPEFHEARDLLAHLLIRKGLWNQGFTLLESRFHKMDNIAHLDNTIPLWNGEEGQGEFILVCSEQGLGDSVHFARYLPLIRKRNWKTVFVVPQALKSLYISSNISDYVFTYEEGLIPATDSKGAKILKTKPQLDAFNFKAQISVMSLPRVFKTEVDSIPFAKGYLSVSPERKALAQKIMNERLPTNQKKVGFVWSGSSSQHPEEEKTSSRRRVLPTDLKELINDSKWVSVSLQKDFASIAGLEFEKLKQLPLTNSFEDTAAIIQELDAVVTIDTSTCHVAAALGKPTFMLSRFDSCWRWLEPNRKDSPWYEQLRIYRKTEINDWSDAIKNLHKDLNSFIHSL